MKRHAKAIVAISALLLTLALGASTASAAPPTTTMGTVSAASYASAHVTGTVNPGGFAFYRFEYSTDEVNWTRSLSNDGLAFGTEAIEVSDDLTGLKGGTQYFVRLAATNQVDPEAISPGPNPSFTTLPVDPPAVLSADDATDVSYTSATASGSVERPANPNPDPAFDANCRFEYVTAAQFTANDFQDASQTSCDVNPVTSTGPTAVKADIGGLQPGTTYHLRLVAENAGGLDALEAASTFTTLAVAAPTVSIDPVTAFTDTSAHFSGKVDPQGDDPAFDTSWLFECTPDCPGLQGGQITDGAEHVVSADATGLEPNTSYQVKLVASNTGGESSAGPEAFKTASVAPAVHTLYAGTIETDSAILAAQINPKNAPVTYQLQWGTDTGYGNSVPATPTALGASDNAFHIVTAPISGLDPGTTYHYRVVATNTETSAVSNGVDHSFETLAPAGPPAPCANAQLRSEQGSANLPDCRAYEKVSLENKGGVNAEEIGRNWVRADGDALVFSQRGPAPGAASGAIKSLMYGTRDAGQGWNAVPLDPPLPSGAFEVTFNRISAFTPDLSKSLLASPAALTPDATYRAFNQAYLHDLPDGGYQLLTPVPGDTSSFSSGCCGGYRTRIVGASANFDRVVYESGVAQTDDDVGPDYTKLSIYEWEAGAGVRLVSLLPDGSIPSGSVRAGAGVDEGTIENATSADGRRTYFHEIAVEPSLFNISVGGRLYARDNKGTPSSADDETQYVSASQRTDCAGDPTCGGDDEPDPAPDPEGPAPAVFQGAEAAHGGKALFTSCEKLTDDATASAAADAAAKRCARGDSPVYTGISTFWPGRDLYLYDADSEELTDITTADPSGADVYGVLGSSDDLSRVYFVAGGALDPDSNGEQPGEPNLYLWEQGSTTYIGTLHADGDEAEDYDAESWSITWGRRLGLTRTSPDGAHLLFSSRMQLTGYDNSSPQCAEERCLEVYLYDAAEERLQCVSCDPSGGPAGADARVMRGVNAPPDGVGDLPLNMLEDGSRVFFEASDALVAGDANGKRDVYQWHEGRVSLVSSGLGASDSFFAGATADGSDVFFSTYDQLTGADEDAFIDMYDARVGGGFPEPAPPTPCVGDGCRGPSTSPPSDPSPQSASFSGPGSAKPNRSRCGKGKVRRSGRCVKRKGKRSAAKRRGNENGRTGR